MSELTEAVKAEMKDAPVLGAALKGVAAKRSAAVSRVAPDQRAEFLATTEGAPIVPMFEIEGDEDLVAAADAFEKAQAEMQKAKDARMAAKSEFLDAEYIYYIKCRHPHPEGMSQHGIYLKGYPHTNTVQGDEWKAGYKQKFENLHHGDNVPCQMCLRYLGITTPLAVTVVKKAGVIAGTFELDPRWLWKRPKDPKRLAIENETRVRQMNYGTGNIGLAEAEARAKAAQLKVVN